MSRYRLQLLLVTIVVYILLSVFVGLILYSWIGIPVWVGFIAVPAITILVRELTD